jgi:uncharacterized membrane protein
MRTGLQKPRSGVSAVLSFGTHVNLPAVLGSANLWLHLFAASVWVGGMIFFLFVFGPAVHSLAPAERGRALNHGRESFQTLSWVAILFLFFTGALNVYFRFAPGAGQLGAGYTTILAIKLSLFVAMIFHHSLQAFKYGPRLASAKIENTGGEWPEPLVAAWKKWFTLLKINLTLGVIVLLLGWGLGRR